MANAKGVIFIGAREFVTQTYGSEAADECFEALLAEDQQLLEGALPIGWYPLDTTIRYLHVVDEVCGEGDLQLCHELGRFAADWALKLLHRVYLRFKTPFWLLEKAPSMWMGYYDSGEWTLLEPGDKSMASQLRNFAQPDEAVCWRLRGWLQRAAELTGAKNVQVAHPTCLARGDECCEFAGHWE